MSINQGPVLTTADGNGVVTADLGNFFARSATAVLQADGKIVVHTDAQNLSASSVSYSELFRYNADGSLDTAFGLGGLVASNVGSTASFDPEAGVALQIDGKIVTGGDGFAVSRYNADGSLDPSFGTGGVVAPAESGTSLAYGILVEPDGKIVASGSDDTFALARFDNTGNLDSSFGIGGRASASFGSTVSLSAHSFFAQPDGKLVVAGRADLGGQDDFALVRYNVDGSLDPSFGSGGKVTTDFSGSDDTVYGAAMQADGKIVVTGAAGVRSFSLARYTADGTLDASFGVGGKVTTTVASGILETAESVAIQTDGKIVVSGHALAGGTQEIALVRYNSDGSLDTSFGTGGKVLTNLGTAEEHASSLLIEADGKIVVAGTSGATGVNPTDLVLVRYNSDGSLDTSFGNGAALDGAAFFTEGGSPTVLNARAAVHDEDLAAAGSYDGASVTLARHGGANSEDVFGASGNLAALTAGGNITLSGVAIGTVTQNSGGTLVLTFGAAATEARVDEAMRDITYSNTSDNPASSVKVDWLFSDGNTGAQGSGAALAAAGSTTVNITPTDDAPVNTVPGPLSTLADTDFAIAGLAVSDVDSTSLSTHLEVDHGTLTVAAAAGATVDFSGTGFVQITGSLAQINATLGGANNVLYHSAAAFAGAETLTMTTRESSVSGFARDSDTVAINVTTVPGSLAINDVSISEGNNASKLATFTVTRSGGTAPIAVDYATADGGATAADNDYVAASGTLNFAQGEKTKTFDITINGDTDFELNETFTVNLSGATNGATISDGSGTGTITNDDVEHVGSVAISDVTISEGDGGTKTADFTVTRSNGTAPFAVNFSTSNGTATTADNDYLATSGTLNFAQFDTIKNISVTIKGDIKVEPDQTFTVNLSGATNGATISDSQGVGTIANDDVNGAPQISPVSGGNITASSPGGILSASDLFSASDLENDSLVYFLYDWSPEPTSGHFEVRGAVVPAQQVIGLTASDLSFTRFVAGAPGSTDDLGVMAFDGHDYSGSTSFTPIHVHVSANHAPAVTVPQVKVAAHAGQVFAASSLFGASDADGNALTYFIYDWSPAASSGHFVVNGSVVAAQTVIGLTAADLAHTTFVAGTLGSTDDLGVMVFDGYDYSGNTSFSPIHVTAVNQAPVVNVPQVNVGGHTGQVLAASSLFSVSDADNDALTYFIYDWNPAPNSGHFVINGVEAPAQTVVGLTTTDLAHTTFVAGSAGVTDDLGVMAFDGHDYSGNTSFNPIHVTGGINHAPVVSVPAVNATASAGEVLAASDLFSVSDADNDALTYFIYDWNATPDSGHFEINGAKVPAQTVIGLSAADIAHTTFIAGALGVTDDLGVMVYDGFDYSGHTSFDPVHVTAVNHAPVVNLPQVNVAAAAGQVFKASDLFSVADADHDALTYFIYDWSPAASSGHFEVNGAVQPSQTVLGLTAAELAHTTFVAGSAGAVDDLGVMAFDGHDYSGHTSFEAFHILV